jgi:hypothetical protein
MERALSILPSNRSVVLPDRRWWMFDGYTNPKALTHLYSVGIMDITKLEYIRLGSQIDPASGSRAASALSFNTALFQFTIPPQQYELTEPTTTQIVPTQGGGKFIESHGSLLKDIRVSGTVGLRPNPIQLGVFGGLEDFGGPKLSIPPSLAMLLADERGLDKDEITGFDDLVFLRNIFRLYSDLKQTAAARRLVMVWTSARDGESWVVEPLSFSTSRDKSNPLGWHYTIQFKTLYLLEQQFQFEEDPVSWWNQIKNAFQTVRNVLNEMAISLNQLATAANWASSLPANLYNDIVSGVFKIVYAERNLGGSLKKNFSRSYVKDLGNKCLSASLFLDRNTPRTGFYLNTSPSSVFPVAVTPSNSPTTEPWSQSGVATVREAIRNIQRQVFKLANMDELWATPASAKTAPVVDAYATNRDQASSGSALSPANMPASNAAYEVTIKYGEDIRSIAREYLGDEVYWKMLAILNNLRAPYVGPKADRVLGPGDKILIPKNATDTTINVRNSMNSDESANQITVAYGRDVRLKQSSFNDGTLDVAVNSRGDLDLIEGLPNIEQALQIKFATLWALRWIWLY